MRSYWSGSTSSADQDQEVALSVFKGSLAAGSTILMHKCRAGSNCNFGPDLVCSSSQRFQLLLHIWRPQGDHEQGLFKISGWSCSSGTRTVLSGSVLSNEWKFCLHISSHTWRSSNVCVPNVRIDAILMNSEIIFLSKQIEQVDITDPSINQRGKTNKPSVKKLECFFLFSKFKDVSPAVQWQRGAQCRWQKGYAHCKGSQSRGKKIASASRSAIPGHYLLLAFGTCEIPQSELHSVITCDVCHRHMNGE